MTIAIGFACKGSLIVATDSQVSDGGTTFQQWGEKKVAEIVFQDGSRALLAKSGSISVGMKAQDVLTPSDAARYFLAEHPDVFTEAYRVGDSIEMVAKERLFRLEAIEALGGNGRRFDIRVYEKKGDSWVIWNGFPWWDNAIVGHRQGIRGEIKAGLTRPHQLFETSMLLPLIEGTLNSRRGNPLYEEGLGGP